jgi:cell division septation protein DedD
MTNIVQVKRITWSLILLGLLVNCDMWNSWFGREEINVGQYVTLQATDAAEESSIKWVFAQLPDSSKLSGFLPADTAAQVSFKPDFAGEYDVLLQVTTGGETEETSYFYKAVVSDDSTLNDQELPDYLLEAEYAGDTTVSDSPVVSLTDTGDQRDYLSKVVPPGYSKKATATTTRRKHTSASQKKVSKPSRGNLIPRAEKTYTIQVSSWPSLEEAQAASRELLDKYGIDSYIQRAFFKDKDEIYYRLRVGNFPDQKNAEEYAKEIQELTSLPVWVDYVRQEM